MSDLGQDIRGRRTYIMKSGETTLNKNCFAIMNTATAGECKRPTGAAQLTDIPVGVLEDASLAAGYEGTFRDEGFAYAVAAGAISIGQECVIAGVTGKITPYVAASHTSGCFKVCRALEAATTDGDTILVQLTITKQAHS